MARLIEDHDDGGRRYYLEDRPIHCGTLLEVYLQGGWLTVRFEMDAQQFPVYSLRLGEGWDQVSMRLPDTAELRWPLRDEHPEETQLRKLRRVVEELADILTSPGSYYDHERERAIYGARLVLRATAPRFPEEPGGVGSVCGRFT